MATRTSGRGANGRKRAKNTTAGSRPGIVSALRTIRERLRNRLGRQTDDVWGLALVVLSLLLVLSLVNLTGPIGATATSGLRFVFGIWVYFVPASLFVIGVAMIGTMPKADYGRLSVGMLVLFVGSMSLFHLMTGTISLAGSVDSGDRTRGSGGFPHSVPTEAPSGLLGRRS